jgi:hypothetical protein
MSEEKMPPQAPTSDDLRIAEHCLRTARPSLGTETEEYKRLVRYMAERRARMGADDFDLMYGLRKPRNAREKAMVDYFIWGKITMAELRTAMRDLFDEERIHIFFDSYEKRIQSYSRMLQTVVEIATDERAPNCWRKREPEVDGHVEAMREKMHLWKEEIETAFEFLTELRTERSTEPVRCGDYSAESAHALAVRVMTHAAQSWRTSKEIAKRSRTEAGYSYATTASSLFYKTSLPGLPLPDNLRSLMVLERAAALKAIRERNRPPAEVDSSKAATMDIQVGALNITTPTVNVAASTCAVKGGTPKDEDSEESTPTNAWRKKANGWEIVYRGVALQVLVKRISTVRLEVE